MFIDWTKNLKTEEEKKNFENKVWSAKEVLDRQTVLIDERLEHMRKAQHSIKTFDTPNWALKRAFMDGFESCAAINKKLIDLDQQKETIYDRETPGL